MFKKYYSNTTKYICVECQKEFTLNFWQWIFRPMKIDYLRHSYVKCPYCGCKHWLKAIKVEE